MLHLIRRSDAFFEQVISALPPDIQDSLTLEQLDALKVSMRQTIRQGQHPIDIRLPIPIPPRGFYVIFAAGPERRSPKRVRQEHPFYPYGAIAAILVTSFITVLLGMGISTGYQALSSSLQSKDERIHPTAIPWLENQASCEDTGRSWDQGQCWDQQHNPNF